MPGRILFCAVAILALTPAIHAETELEYGEFVASAGSSESSTYSAEFSISLDTVTVEQSSAKYSISSTMANDEENITDFDGWFFY